MALSELTFTDAPAVSVTAKKDGAGDDYVDPTFKLNITKPSISIKNSIANATAGGGDQIYSTILTIAGSGTTSVDLKSFTNLAAETSCSFARVKYVKIRLLSTTDDTAGTACTGIAVEPHATNGWQAILPILTSSPNSDSVSSRILIGNGVAFTIANPSAAGWTVDNTHKVLLITNLDSGVSAHVQITVVGGTT